MILIKKKEHFKNCCGFEQIAIIKDFSKPVEDTKNFAVEYKLVVTGKTQGTWIVIYQFVYS